MEQFQNRKDKGKYGENIAIDFLEKNGYIILEKNFRFSRYGEIDIIALDKEIIVFVEVKFRTSNKYGMPIEAITTHKKNHLIKSALFYLQEKKCFGKPCRFDIISIENDKIDLYKNAFLTKSLY